MVFYACRAVVACYNIGIVMKRFVYYMWLGLALAWAPQEAVAVAPLPPPVPADVCAAATEEFLLQMPQKKHTAWAAGQVGPGYSPDTAWVVHHVEARRFHKYAGSMLELFVRAKAWKKGGYKLVGFYDQNVVVKGKAYICITLNFETTAEGMLHHVKQWYDVSAYVPYESEAAVAEAKQRLVQSVHPMTQLLQSVHDQSTAEAAASLLEKDYEALYTQAKYARKWLWPDRKELYQQIEAAGGSVQEFETALYKVQQQGYYGSARLQRVLLSINEG